jgi:hypothetical protein
MNPQTLETYLWLKNKGILGERQEEVYLAINDNPNLTDRELTQELDKEDPNYVRPRRRELSKIGLIEESSVRRCKLTGRSASTWRVADTNIEQVSINLSIEQSKRDSERELQKLRVKLDLANKLIERQNKQIRELEEKITTLNNY